MTDQPKDVRRMVDLAKFAFEFPAPAKDLDKLAKEADNRAEERARQSRFGDLRTFTFPVGKTEFLICPPYSDRGFVHYSTFTHWQLGEGGKSRAFCPKHTHPEKGWGCPICFVIDLALRNGVDQDRLVGFNTPEQQEATYLQVLLLESDGADIDSMEYLPTVVRISPSIKDKLIGYYARWKEAIYNPNEAIIFEMTKTMKKGRGGRAFPNYDLSPLPEKIAMAEDEDGMRAIIDGMYDLEAIGFFTGQWTEYDFRQSVSLANHLLDELGFRTIDSWAGSLDDDWEEDPKEIEAKGLPSLPEELKGKGMKRQNSGGGGAAPKHRRPSRKRGGKKDDDDEQEDD